MLKAFHFVPKEMALAKFSDIRHLHCLGGVSIRRPLQKGLRLRPRITEAKGNGKLPLVTPSDLPAPTQTASPGAKEWSAAQLDGLLPHDPPSQEKAFQHSHASAFPCGRESCLGGCCV